MTINHTYHIKIDVGNECHKTRNTIWLRARPRCMTDNEDRTEVTLGPSELCLFDINRFQWDRMSWHRHRNRDRRLRRLLYNMRGWLSRLVSRSSRRPVARALRYRRVINRLIRGPGHVLALLTVRSRWRPQRSSEQFSRRYILITIKL